MLKNFHYYTQQEVDDFLAAIDLNDLADVNVPAPNDADVLTWDNATSKWISAAAGGVSDFVGLTDTPANYVGAGNKFVKVNAGANALEFISESTINHDGLTNYVANEHMNTTAWAANLTPDANNTRSSGSVVENWKKVHTRYVESNNNLRLGALTYSSLIVGGSLILIVEPTKVYPGADSTIDIGRSTKYFKCGYIDRLYLNATAYFDGATAAIVSLIGNLCLPSIKSGANQAGAGAAAHELWKTNSHATLPDNVVMIGV